MASFVADFAIGSAAKPEGLLLLEPSQTSLVSTERDCFAASSGEITNFSQLGSIADSKQV